MTFYRPVWSDLYDFALNRLEFGSHCVLCRGHGAQSRDLCDACEALLQRCLHTDRGGRGTQLCLACGDEFAATVSDESECPDCLVRGSPFQKIVAPYRYAFPLDKMIHQLKYGDRRLYARVLGSLLSTSIAEGHALPDCLIPVPMAPGREKTRGYNQAADIARWCADGLDVAYWPHAAKRVVDTGSLAGLSRAARQLKIVGVFRADPVVCGKRIAIVDDVLTTGATARELATELYDSGALSVELWVLARTSSTR